MAHTPDIVPVPRCRDGHAAIAFLTRAFGPEVVQAHDAADGRLLHAELRHGNGVIMMGTADRPKGSPGLYLAVEDVQAHPARAAGAGATIIDGPERTDWGTWRSRARDPEGHEWSFGTYRPQTEPPDRA